MTTFASEFIPILLRASCGLAAAAVLVALLIRIIRIRSAAVQQTLWLFVLLQGVVLARVPVELPWPTFPSTSPPVTTSTFVPDAALTAPVPHSETSVAPPQDALAFDRAVPTAPPRRMVTQD